jgi:hypothetical protein
MTQQTVSSSREETLRRLSFIEDPVKQIQLMIGHNLMDDAWEQFSKLIGSNKIHFQHSSRVSDYVNIGKVSKASDDNTDTFVCLVSQKTCFTVEGISRLFSFDDEQSLDFVEKLLVQATTIDPKHLTTEIGGWAGSWERDATEKALDKFFPEEKTIRRDIHCWILIGCFFAGPDLWICRDEDWWLKMTGRVLPENRYNHHDWKFQSCDLEVGKEKTDQWCDRMREFGFPSEEIQEMLLVWIKRFGPHSLNPEFIIYVAGCKEIQYRNRGRVNKAIQSRFDGAMEYLHPGSGLYSTAIVANLFDCGMSHPKQKETFIEWTAQKLAEGKLGIVSMVWEQLAKRFGIEDQNSRKMTLRESFDFSVAAGIAFDKAVSKTQFGIAAALVLQFGQDKCLDLDLLEARAKRETGSEDKAVYRPVLTELVEERRVQIREAFAIAQTMAQPIRFDLNLNQASL